MSGALELSTEEGCILCGNSVVDGFSFWAARISTNEGTHNDVCLVTGNRQGSKDLGMKLQRLSKYPSRTSYALLHPWQWPGSHSLDFTLIFGVIHLWDICSWF